MANPSDLILGVLFKANEDPNFKRITRRLASIITEFNNGMSKVERAQRAAKKSTAELDKELQKLSKDMKKTGDITDSTNKQIGKITKGIDRLIAAFKVVAVYTVAGRVFQGFQAAVRMGVREIIEFDQALANLKAITGATDAEIQGMRDTLKDTALRTKFSTTEIAEGMVLLGQAGLSGAESIQAIDAVADLAAGTLSDFRTVADLVTTTLRAFGLEAVETRRVADVMASAVNKSKLTIDKLRTAFNYVGASAAQAGLSLEQTAATMMVLANSGLRASTIGTGFRQVLARLLSPSTKLREAMSRYGLELDKATGQSDWFTKQLDKLSTVMYDFEKNTVDMSKAYALFGLRGAQAAAILINAYNDLDGTWEIMLDRASQVGTANEMMLRQAEGLGFKIKNLADSFGVLAVNLGEAGLTSVLRGAVDAMRDFVKAAGKGVDLTVGRATVTFVGFAGALFTVKLAIQAIAHALAGREWATLAGLRAFFFGPWGWVVIALAAVAAGFVALSSAVGRAREEMVKQGIEAEKIITNVDTYRKQLNKVSEGSKEYEILVARLKQAMPDYADQIDAVSYSYEKLADWLDEVRTKQEGLSIASTGQVFLADMKRLTEDVGDLSGDVMTDKITDMMKSGLDKNKAEMDKTISEFVYFVFGKFAKRLKEGEDIVDVKGEVWSMFFGDLGEYREIAEKYPKITETVLAKLRKMFDEYEEHRKRMAEDRLARERETIETLPKIYQDFIDKLWDEKQYNMLLDFLKKIKQSRQDWETKKEEWEATSQKRFKNEQEREEALALLQKQHYKGDLQAFLDSYNKKKNNLTALYNLRKKIATMEGRSIGGYEGAYKEMKATYDKIAQDIKKNVKDNEEAERMLRVLWTSFYTELYTLAQKYGIPPHMTTEVLKDLNELAGKAKMPTTTAAPAYTRPEEWHGRPRGMSKEEYDEQEIKDQEALWNAEKERVQRETGEVEENYRRGTASAQDYYDAIDRMKRYDLITEKEALKKKRTEQQNWWENIKEGWNDHFKEMQTTGEWLQELGGDLVEQLSTGFADAWGDFVSGAKSAQEAMADFARDTLRWLAQIFAKKMMMEALSWMGLHGGGMYGEQSFTRRMRRPAFVPKLHDGLMPNEFAAILTKDEAVFTPKQMKALGAMIKGTTEINVPVNISGAGADTAGKYMPQEIEQTVLKVMRKYM